MADSEVIKEVQWIFAGEIVPDNEREVLVMCLNDNKPFSTTGQYFSNGNVWRIGEEYHYDVVYWAEYPEMPVLDRDFAVVA